VRSSTDDAPQRDESVVPQDLPTVAIVGRPNVGKSTFLNRIVGRREAIVEERPGVTRDRKEVVADWSGHEFVVIDTGGWLPGGDDLDRRVSRQAERAVEDADVLVMVVDVTVGITEEDGRIATLLRRADKPVFLAVNKVDGEKRELDMWDFARLGVGDPHPISALHGRRTGDLLDEIVAALPAPAPEPVIDQTGVDEAVDRVFSVALVGRPNVGKSTLFNGLIGDDRSVVHDVAGTTRDSIDTLVETDDGPVRFIDTAGMRRRAKITDGTEYYSMVRALQSVDTADVALLVIDSTIGVTHQDQRLAERVAAAGCPAVVLLNKWELLDADDRRVVERQMGDRLHFLGEAPVLKVSALTGKGVHRLLPALMHTIDEYHTRVPTRQVNKVLREAQMAQPAPAGARVLYATQGAADPPTFTLFVNRPVPPTYLRYLERCLREKLGLGATPVKLRVRARSA
jgi:GTP-binding protein